MLKLFISNDKFRYVLKFLLQKLYCTFTLLFERHAWVVFPFMFEIINTIDTRINTHVKQFYYCLPTFNTSARFMVVNVYENYAKDNDIYCLKKEVSKIRICSFFIAPASVCFSCCLFVHPPVQSKILLVLPY